MFLARSYVFQELQMRKTAAAARAFARIKDRKQFATTKSRALVFPDMCEAGLRPLKNVWVVYTLLRNVRAYTQMSTLHAKRMHRRRSRRPFREINNSDEYTLRRTLNRVVSHR